MIVCQWVFGVMRDHSVKLVMEILVLNVGVFDCRALVCQLDWTDVLLGLVVRLVQNEAWNLFLFALEQMETECVEKLVELFWGTVLVVFGVVQSD